MSANLFSKTSSKALFLDRDGVINVNHGYVGRIEDFNFIPGIFELCKAAQDKGYRLIIVTNQSGIARGYYTQKDFAKLSRWVEHAFWKRGIRITHTYHCPHHPKQRGPFGFNCTCRKPKPGMLIKAQQQFRINMHESIMVGDSLSDMRCAQRAGVGKAVYLSHRSPGFTPRLLEQRCKKPYYRASHLSTILPLL